MTATLLALTPAAAETATMERDSDRPVLMMRRTLPCVNVQGLNDVDWGPPPRGHASGTACPRGRLRRISATECISSSSSAVDRRACRPAAGHPGTRKRTMLAWAMCHRRRVSEGSSTEA
ncbi:unnamed protein product [Arctogadus glacialis]